MKNKMIICFIIGLLVVVELSLVSTAQSSFASDATDIQHGVPGPSYTTPFKAFIVGRISGVDKDTYSHEWSIHSVFVVGYVQNLASESLHIPLPFITLQRTFTYWKVNEFYGYLSQNWICGTVYYTGIIGFP